MKNLLWAMVAIMLGFSAVEGEVVDRVLAKVNDDIITLSELNRAMASYRKELAGKYAGQQLDDMIKKTEGQLLDRLIERKLIIQKGMEMGYDSTVESSVASEVQNVMKENKIPDTETLEKALAQQGMTMRELREQIRDVLIERYVVSDFVGSRITVLTPEIEKYYKDHVADFTTPEEVTLSEIVIQGEGSGAEAGERADDLYRRLQQGEAFAALASQYSKGVTAGKGGSIGTYVVSDLRPDMVSAIKGLKEGDISKPQKTKEGYVIYHVDSRKYAAVKPLDEVKEEIKQRIFDLRFDPEYKRFIARLKEDAYIQIYSESPPQ